MQDRTLLTKLGSLAYGMPFRFPGKARIYMHYGGGFYATPTGYDGGPWHTPQETEVEPVKCVLQSQFLETLSEEEVRLLVPSHTAVGDIALMQFEYRRRGLTQRLLAAS